MVETNRSVFRLFHHQMHASLNNFLLLRIMYPQQDKENYRLALNEHSYVLILDLISINKEKLRNLLEVQYLTYELSFSIFLYISFIDHRSINKRY